MWVVLYNHFGGESKKNAGEALLCRARGMESVSSSARCRFFFLLSTILFLFLNGYFFHFDFVVLRLLT